MDKFIYTLKSSTHVIRLILTKCTLVWQLQVIPVPNFMQNLTVCHKYELGHRLVDVVSTYNIFSSKDTKRLEQKSLLPQG